MKFITSPIPYPSIDLLDDVEKRNARAFDGIEKKNDNIKYRWFHTFRYMLLGHLEGLDDFEIIINHLIEM